jgi:predicted aspartyl protease
MMKNMTATISITLCVLLALSLATAPVHAKPRTTATPSVQEVAIIGTDPRAYEVAVLLNDTLPTRAVIDTGATSLYLPYEVYLRLRQTGTLRREDVLSPTTYKVVGGQTFTAERRLVALTLGAYRIPNVEATIGTTGGNILIGSEVLQRFQSFGIDHTRRVLRLGSPR